MKALLYQLGITLRLHFRNKLALLYGYLFPTVFLVVFWVLYRHESVPLIRHVGALLTVTALGGACFGLPTAMVSERERGVWRRFRLTPAHTGALIASTIIARYLLLLTAALLQLALAMAVFGMPMPQHPLDLLFAFSVVAFAFLGLGLVIAMAADNVPAVQALGQCIFLPMLVIGGVAVRIEALPEWAQHVSAYFPGRYAVEALQVSVTGDGLGSAGFPLFALLLIGGAGFLVGAKLFRWDQEQHFARLAGKKWVAVALAAWICVGGLAQATGRVAVGVPLASGGETLRRVLEGGVLPQEPGVDITPPEAGDEEEEAAAEPAADSAPIAPDPVAERAPIPQASDVDTGVAQQPDRARPDSEGVGFTALQDIDSNIDYSRLPPDDGLVTPFARPGEIPPADVSSQLECMRMMIPGWAPVHAPDQVQRVRNYLFIPAVVDVYQTGELELWVPVLVLELLQREFDAEALARTLYRIAMDPSEGDVSAAGQLSGVCFERGAPHDLEQLLERVGLYALKLLGRVTGRIPGG